MLIDRKVFAVGWSKAKESLKEFKSMKNLF